MRIGPQADFFAAGFPLVSPGVLLTKITEFMGSFIREAARIKNPTHLHVERMEKGWYMQGTGILDGAAQRCLLQSLHFRASHWSCRDLHPLQGSPGPVFICTDLSRCLLASRGCCSSPRTPCKTCCPSLPVINGVFLDAPRSLNRGKRRGKGRKLLSE